MANAIWSKDGVEFKETPDTPEFSETAKTKGYKRYYDITKDDKDVKTVPEDMLETAKAKGYKIFGQPAIEQKPVEEPKPAETPKPVVQTKAEEPGLLQKAGDFAGRAVKSAGEAIVGLPGGLYELGKEVVTQPAEAIPAAATGVAKTFGLAPIGGAVAGAVEAGKALFTDEDVGPAFKRGYEEEVAGVEQRAQRAKEVSPAAYSAGPYAATAALTGGAGLPAVMGAEALTGAAQQLAEKGEVDTAELAGQTLAVGPLAAAAKGAQSAVRAVESRLPVQLTKGAKEARASRLEKAAIDQAEDVGGLGDVAEKYVGEGAKEKIRTAKRAGYEVGQAKADLTVEKTNLQNRFVAEAFEIDQRNAARDANYATQRAQRAQEYNDLVNLIDQENSKGRATNQEKLTEYNTKLDAWNQETSRLETQYQDSKQKHAIEKADLKKREQEQIKKVDEGYLGAREKYLTEELPEYEKTRQQELQAAEQSKQQYKMDVAEWQAQTKKAVNDLRAEQSQALREFAQKAKEAKRTFKGEAVTAMGDELRGMLDNMDQVQKEAYSARKMMAEADANIVESVDDAATAKAIFDVERSLNSNYMLDDLIREDFKAIKMKVDPDLQEGVVSRGVDFEALLELRQYLDNLNNDLRNQAKGIQRQGGSVPVELTRKRQSIYEARQNLQKRLYGEDSVFSQELKDLGEAADGVYSEFKRAKGVMQQKGLLAKQKAVPGVVSDLEPRANLIEDYFDELDAGRKSEMKSLLTDFGVDTSRLDILEQQVRRGVIAEPVAIRQLELPVRPTGIFQPSLTPKPTAPMRPLPSQYQVEGSASIAPAKPVMPAKPIKPVLTPEQRVPKFVTPPKPVREVAPSARLKSPEELSRMGQIGEQTKLAKEYQALGGKASFDDRGIPLSKQGIIERIGEYASEATGIGTTAMQKLEKAAEIRATPALFNKLQAQFAETAPNLAMGFRVLTSQGIKITPALIRSIAQRNNVSEEEVATAIVESQTP